ncbi:MAG: hypothetical protein LBP78_06805 [Acidaminococcales bacterium]|jgi:hypothetical protein|nr:hypothetical protein [Acidaminococcales bacterium]
MPAEGKGSDGSLTAGGPDLLALTFREARERLEADGRPYTVAGTSAPFARAGGLSEQYVANCRVTRDGTAELLLCVKAVREDIRPNDSAAGL